MKQKDCLALGSLARDHKTHCDLQCLHAAYSPEFDYHSPPVEQNREKEGDDEEKEVERDSTYSPLTDRQIRRLRQNVLYILTCAGPASWACAGPASWACAGRATTANSSG
jgi:hypothetical protein